MVNKKFNLRPFGRIEKRGKVNLSRQWISQAYLRAHSVTVPQQKHMLKYLINSRESDNTMGG